MFLTEGARPLTPEEIQYWMETGQSPAQQQIPNIDQNRQNQIRNGINQRLDEINKNKVYREVVEDDINEYSSSPQPENNYYQNYQLVNSNEFPNPDMQMQIRMMQEMGYMPQQQYNPYQQQPYYGTPPMDTRPMINSNPYNHQGYQPVYNHNNVNMNNGNMYYQSPYSYLGGYYTGNYYQAEYERQMKAQEAARRQAIEDECEIMKAISRAANFGLKNGLTEEQIERKWNNIFFPEREEDNLDDEDKLFISNYNFLTNIYYNAPYGNPIEQQKEYYKQQVRQERMKLIPKDCDINKFFNEVSLAIYERDEKIEEKKRKVEELNNIYNHRAYDDLLDKRRKERLMEQKILHPYDNGDISDMEIEEMKDKEYKAKEEAYMREMARAAGMDYEEAVKKYGTTEGGISEEDARSNLKASLEHEASVNSMSQMVNTVRMMDHIQATTDPNVTINLDQDDLFNMIINGASMEDILDKI